MDARKSVHSFLRHLGQTTLWEQYSVKGARGKRALNDCKVYELMFGEFFFVFAGAEICLLK